MKTKIAFSVNSTEITKQIAELITAEEKAAARKLALSTFEKALKAKIASLIEKMDGDLSESGWRKSELRIFIRSAIKEAIDVQFKDNADGIKDYVKAHLEREICEYRATVSRFLLELNKKIEDEVEKQVKACMENTVLRAVLNAIATENGKK